MLKPLRSFLWIPSVFALLVGPAQGQGPGNSLKIGTYDSRAIAVAYAPSKFNPIRENMAKYKAAKAAKDKPLMEDLEAWGKKHQRELHRQGFATVPVSNLLEHVKDGLPEVAESAGVLAIVRACDFTAPNVQTVDVTDQLVKLFDPSERTLKTVREIRKVDPVHLDDVEQHHDH